MQQAHPETFRRVLPELRIGGIARLYVDFAGHHEQGGITGLDVEPAYSAVTRIMISLDIYLSWCVT